jgi:hypothetical protein
MAHRYSREDITVTIIGLAGIAAVAALLLVNWTINKEVLTSPWLYRTLAIVVVWNLIAGGRSLYSRGKTIDPIDYPAGIGNQLQLRRRVPPAK